MHETELFVFYNEIKCEGVKNNYMDKFKGYSFSRLILHSKMEFFFIIGEINPDNFDEHWNGTGHTVLGYLVIYKDHELKNIKNIIYLIPDYKSDYSNIKRYTHRFVDLMNSAELFSYDNKFNFKQTIIKGNLVVPPYIDFVKEIVGKDIPHEILNDITV